jgi:lipid-binding SYLF domain-containing protein
MLIALIQVIKNAKGLAIFTTMRTGLWFSGAGGSGVLVGRKEDGTWSPPSGIMLHTAGLGFLVGVDIYDCVVVINTQQALDAFATIRCTLGGEISAVAGPVGIGGVLESEVHKRQAPVFTYLKSRGFYAGVQVDGTIVIERTDENERFYGERIGVKDILAGKARYPPREIRPLLETIKAAQGDTDVDTSLLPNEPPPADFEIENNRQMFGVPDQEDPDPFGVLALEQAGFEIREAGTQKRPPSEQFEFKPSPTSPIYTTFRHSMDRSSMDSRSRRSSWRTSTITSVLESRESRASTMVDSETQTDLEPSSTTQTPPALPPRPSHNGSPTMADIPEDKSIDEIKADTTPAQNDNKDVVKHEDPKADDESLEDVNPELSKYLSGEHPASPVSEPKDVATEDSKPQIAEDKPAAPEITPNTHSLEESSTNNDAAHTATPKILTTEEKSQLRPLSEARKSMAFNDDSDDDEYDGEEEEEPVIQQIYQASAPQPITANRARIVQVAKPVPPKLPARSPLRTRHSVNSDISSSGEGDTKDAASGTAASPPIPASAPRTPSLKHDGSSMASTASTETMSSCESISSMEGLAKTVSQLDVQIPDVEKEALRDVPPESPKKSIPGGFHS